VSRAADYRAALRALPAAAWDAFLLRESGLPGPRANLELVQAAADEGSRPQFERWLAIDAATAPTDTRREFLPLCGAVGLGRLVAEGQLEQLALLRRHAADARWRVREGVALALQRLGAVDLPRLLAELTAWQAGGWLERRAVVAAICEPPLLRDSHHADQVLACLDAITVAVAAAPRAERGAEFRVLRQALGYGWSVVVAAYPAEGKPRFEAWIARNDADVRWIVRENLKKSRLQRLDPGWVARCAARMGR